MNPTGGSGNEPYGGGGGRPFSGRGVGQGSLYANQPGALHQQQQQQAHTALRQLQHHGGGEYGAQHALQQVQAQQQPLQPAGASGGMPGYVQQMPGVVSYATPGLVAAQPGAPAGTYYAAYPMAGQQMLQPGATPRVAQAQGLNMGVGMAMGGYTHAGGAMPGMMASGGPMQGGGLQGAGLAQGMPGGGFLGGATAAHGGAHLPTVFGVPTQTPQGVVLTQALTPVPLMGPSGPMAAAGNLQLANPGMAAAPGAYMSGMGTMLPQGGSSLPLQLHNQGGPLMSHSLHQLQSQSASGSLQAMRPASATHLPARPRSGSSGPMIAGGMHPRSGGMGMGLGLPSLSGSGQGAGTYPSLGGHPHHQQQQHMQLLQGSSSTSSSQQRRRQQKGLEQNIKRTIYVSYIDLQVTEEALANFFSECGPVQDCRICGDPNSAMRFAFLEFADVESAQRALAKSGTILGATPLRVLPSKTAIVPVSQDFMPRSADEVERCSRTVYVANIDKKVDRGDVRAFFEQLCGTVSKLRLLGDMSHPTRIAFVEFAAAEGAQAALNCSGALLGSQPIRVSPSKTPVRAECGRGGDKQRARERRAKERAAAAAAAAASATISSEAELAGSSAGAEDVVAPPLGGVSAPGSMQTAVHPNFQALQAALASGSSAFGGTESSAILASRDFDWSGAHALHELEEGVDEGASDSEDDRDGAETLDVDLTRGSKGGALQDGPVPRIRQHYVTYPMQANDAATLAAQLQGISLGLVPPRVVAPRVSGAAVSSQDNNEGLVPSVAAQAAGASVPGGPGSAPAALSSGPRPRAAPGPSSLSTSTAPADGPGSAESARNNDAGVSAAGDAGEAPTAAQAQADAPALAE